MEAAQDFMSDYAWHPEAIFALCAAAEDHLLKFFEVCRPRLYRWLNTYALLLTCRRNRNVSVKQSWSQKL
jgi:hypothetical protein